MKPIPNRWLEAIVQRTDRDLRRYLAQRIGNSADVEDLSQEIYLWLLRIERKDLIRSPEAHGTLPNGITLRLGLDYTFTSEMFNDVQNTALLGRPKVHILDAVGRATSPSGKLTFSLGGTNITDRRYITTGQPQLAGGVVFGTYNAPREWYATLALQL